jgi:hypothetical protein
VSTKVSEAELRVLESRAERAGLTLSEWVRDVLLGSSVDAGTMAAERAILAEMLAMRAILLNFMLKLSMRQPITEQVSRELIEWADSNKMKRALEVLAGNPGTDGTFPLISDSLISRGAIAPSDNGGCPSPRDAAWQCPPFHLRLRRRPSGVPFSAS